MTIYEKSPNQLIRTGERSITSFPSGLMRVDQLYVGKSGNESDHRAQLSYGAVMPGQSDLPDLDGVFIFPEIQESRDGQGFTRYQASGYGRTTDQPRELSRTQQTLKMQGGFDNAIFNISVIVVNTTNTIVKRLGEVVTDADFTFDESLLLPFAVIYDNFPERIFQSVTETNVLQARFGTVRVYEARFLDGDIPYALFFRLIDPKVEIIAQRNFGKFTEYEVALNRGFITFE